MRHGDTEMGRRGELKKGVCIVSDFLRVAASPRLRVLLSQLTAY
jgi:hypothetical protein